MIHKGKFALSACFHAGIAITLMSSQLDLRHRSKWHAANMPTASILRNIAVRKVPHQVINA